MRRLRQCSERNFGWALYKVQIEGLTKGWGEDTHAMRPRQVRKKFGLNWGAEWFDLVAEPGLPTSSSARRNSCWIAKTATCSYAS